MYKNACVCVCVCACVCVCIHMFEFVREKTDFVQSHIDPRTTLTPELGVRVVTVFNKHGLLQLTNTLTRRPAHSTSGFRG